MLIEEIIYLFCIDLRRNHLTRQMNSDGLLDFIKKTVVNWNGPEGTDAPMMASILSWVVF